MLRNPPVYTYNGLSVILSAPSRFDDKGLMSGTAGWLVNRDCFQPAGLNRYQCDIRLIDETEPLLPNTKCILLLGEKAHRLYTKANTTLDENRGNPIIVNGIPTISSFSPQDCIDFKNYEKTKNPLYESLEEFLSEEIAAGEVVSNKGRNKTSRENYKFWLANDVRKCGEILSNNGKLPEPLLPKPEYIIRPSSNELIQVLLKTKGDFLHIDIETDFQTLDIRCISFAYESNPTVIYIFPVLDIYYKPAYDNLHQIFRALSIAFRDNCVVAHNGAVFDFFVFAYKYNISIGSNAYDTLIAQHRINPTVEKSLGHCMSRYTFEPYHKNEGNHSYRSNSQADELMLYCGKDVYGMMLVKKAQEKLMEKDKGLKLAIEWSNKAIRPYLLLSYLGMKYDEDLRQKWIKQNDKQMTGLLKCMQILTGTDDPFPLISNKKATEYFHEQLGYKVVKRKADTGNPSLDEGALLELKKKYKDNIVIDFLIKYRGIKKETGDLGFKAWIPLKNEVLL